MEIKDIFVRNMYSSLSKLLLVRRSNRGRWKEQVARIGDETCTQLVGNRKMGKLLGRPWRRWKTTIKNDLKE